MKKRFAVKESAFVIACCMRSFSFCGVVLKRFGHVLFPLRPLTSAVLPGLCENVPF